MVRSHLGSKFFAASSRQSYRNRTAMFQAIVPYEEEEEFSPTNPPQDIQPFLQYYEMRKGVWWCKSCWKYMNLEHSKTERHKGKIAWEKQQQVAQRMGYSSGASSSSGIGCFYQVQPPPPPPLLPAPYDPVEIPPAPPVTSSAEKIVKQSELVELVEVIEKQAYKNSEQMEKQTVVIKKQTDQIEQQTQLIKKQADQIEQQTQLIKKQAELYEELTKKQAELMEEIAAISDNMKQLAADVAELKSWWAW